MQMFPFDKDDLFCPVCGEVSDSNPYKPDFYECNNTACQFKDDIDEFLRYEERNLKFVPICA